MIIIKNIEIISPGFMENINSDIIIDNDKILDIGPDKANEYKNTDAIIINGIGLTACPGLIDMHVHLRDPGQTYKEDIITGANAAAAGGVTSVIAMPNTNPTVDSVDTLNYIYDKAKAAPIRIYQTAAVTKGLKGEILNDFAALKNAGAIAFSDDGRPVSTANYMYEAMKAAALLNIPVLSHAEDLSLANGGIINEGIISEGLNVKGIPSAAEDVGTARELALAQAYNLPVHICHVSTCGSLNMIRDMKNRNIPVTCETGPHYFTFTDKELLKRDANFRMNPPLRSEQDKQAVINAIMDGTIDAIATDHAPHSIEDKSDFEKAPNGIIGLETSLAVAITNLVKPGFITLSRLIELMSTNPAKIMNIPGGILKPGCNADITIFNKDEQWIVDKNKFLSRARNSPFDSMTLTGKVKYTICAGKLVYSDL